MATKIGVYFDHSAITGGVDVEALAEGVTTRWGELAPVVKVFPLMASKEARAEIVEDISENGLDGVLLCGSSPRFDWDLYQFSGVQTERVNLREGCILSYQNPDGSPLDTDPDAEAPESLRMMVVDYVNMGVIKLQKSAVPTPSVLESTKHILVLGGGWTGLTAAASASKAGYTVTLVEQLPVLGGKANTMLKSIPINSPVMELRDTNIEAKAAGVQEDSAVTVYTSSTLSRLSGEPGQYSAEIATPDGVVTVAVGAVVLATGWVPMGTAALAPLGYGKTPRVMTASEFELQFKEGKIDAKRVAFLLDTSLCTSAEPEVRCSCDDEPAAEKAAPAEAAKTDAAKTDAAKTDAAKTDGQEVAAAWTDLESLRHLSYSKAISSMVALKQAMYVAGQSDSLAYILYDDIVALGLHERFYKAAQDMPNIMLTKADIRSVEPMGDTLSVYADNTLLGGSIEIEVDLVVLPTGMVPTTAKSPVMQFNYRQGPSFPDLDLFDGFADSNYICFPYETRRTGVYAAGCVRQPMTFDAAEDDANGAVLKAIQCIESAGQGIAVHPRSGDLSYPVFNFLRCTQCKRCTEECPFGALDDDEKGTPKPNPARCRRCGTCMGACPERVISFENYNVDQIGSMIRDIKVPDDMAVGGPRVLILACENDAYPAIDMAAMRGKTWSPYVRIIPVRCLGSINAIWVADAMSKGIDGVMLMGCKYGDDYQCHFVKGSEICNKRKENIAESLDRLGVEADRVAQFEVAIDEYDKVPVMIDEFMQMIFVKGPNPFKGY